MDLGNVEATRFRVQGLEFWIFVRDPRVILAYFPPKSCYLTLSFPTVCSPIIFGCLVWKPSFSVEGHVEW